MFAYTTIMPAKGVGAGTDLVSGIVDQNGASFTPLLMHVHGNGPLNVMTQYARRSMGYDNGVTRLGQAIDEFYHFNGKIVCTLSSGQYSILSEQASVFGGGLTQRLANVSAFGSGTALISYAQNDITGDAYAVTFLGGSDLLHALGGVPGGASTITTGWQVVAAMLRAQTLFASTGDGAGGGGMSIGWAATGLNQAVSATQIVNQGGNARYQRIIEAGAEVSAGVAINERVITALDPTGFSVGVGAGGYAYAAFGGVMAAAGVATVGASVVSQEIVTGLDNRIVFLSSIGAPAGTVVLTDYMQTAFGMSDGVRQNCMFGIEDTVGNGIPLRGARFLSNTDVLLFATTPAAAATAITARAQVTGFSVANTSFFLNCSQADGIARQVAWLALGDAPPAPPPPPAPGEPACVLANPGVVSVRNGCTVTGTLPLS